MFGLLNLNKPAGRTSRNAVNCVARLAGRNVKVGHAGTLDPIARGVLIVCLGPATRLVPFLHEQSKAYRATFRLGLTSDTEDITGRLLAVPMPPSISAAAIQEVLPQFTGEIQQTPPQFSALKVDGQRAYDLARAGQEVKLPSRPVTIHNIRLVDCTLPDFTLEIECSTGTYVRTLGRDIAQQLGTDAAMTDLVRTRVGEFSLDEACELEQLQAPTLPRSLQSPLRALPNLPQVTVDQQQQTVLTHGLPLALTSLPEPTKDPRIAVINEQAHLIAIARRDTNTIAPLLVFPATVAVQASA